LERRTNQTDVLLEQVFFDLGTKNLSVTPQRDDHDFGC
jgi:hypothetical protein